MKSGDQVAAAAVLAMLAEIDSLPSSELEPTPSYWQGELAADQDGFDVRGHVVWPLQSVLVVGRAFRDHLVEMAFQISTYIRIGILIDRQGGRGMLKEEMEQPDFDLTDLGQCCKDFLGDQMKASRTGG